MREIYIKNTLNKFFTLCVLFIICQLSYAFAYGWTNMNGDVYWQDIDGSIRTGFIILGDTAYYCGIDGKLVVAPKDTFLLVNDSVYQNKFYVDDKGVVTMNDNDNSHWVKRADSWYHFGKDGQIEKDIWIYRKSNDKIYRVGHDGRMCRGWFIDPETSISYYSNYDIDGGEVIMDNLGSTYEQVYNRLVQSINKDKIDQGGDTNTPTKERAQN